jgi:hypothetical protein
VNGPGAGQPRFNPGGYRDFPLGHHGTTQPYIQWVSNALSPRKKRPEREDDQPLPPTADDENAWIYTSTSSIVLFIAGFIQVFAALPFPNDNSTGKQASVASLVF